MPVEDLCTREEIASFIHSRVWEGFHGFEAIRNCVLPRCCEMDTWVEYEIGRQLCEKRLAECSWPQQTDCDKLDLVFADLTKHGIIALQAPAPDLPGSLGAVRDAWIEDGGDTSTKVGYVVFSTACVQKAQEDGRLQLALDVIPVSPRVKRQKLRTGDVATILFSILKARGLQGCEVGNKRQTITVDPFRWQKRSPKAKH